MLNIVFIEPIDKIFVEKFNVQGVNIAIIEKLSDINIDKCHVIISSQQINDIDNFKPAKYILVLEVEDLVLEEATTELMIYEVISKLHHMYSKSFDLTKKNHMRLYYNLLYETNMPNHIRNITHGVSQWRYYYLKEYFIGKTLLDVGSGSGDIYHTMAEDKERNTFDKIIAIDVSDFSLNIIKNYFNGIETYRVDLMEDNQLDYPSDIALCQEVLEHVPKPRRVIEYCYRNSKKAIFTTPIGHHSDDPSHLHHWTDDSQLEDLFKGYDFEWKKIGKDNDLSHYLIVLEGKLL